MPSANRAEEGFLHLWWEALLIGKVKEATETAVEELMKRIAEEPSGNKPMARNSG